MQFSSEKIKANVGYFTAKLSAEKQKYSVTKWANGDPSAGDIVILDVRDRESFAQGHIKGALCVPLSELRSLMAQLPKDRELVTYCSHHY